MHHLNPIKGFNSFKSPLHSKCKGRNVNIVSWEFSDHLRVNAHKNRPKSPISGTSRKIDFACILPIDRS